MKKNYILLLVLLFVTNSFSYCQTKHTNCNCPKSDYFNPVILSKPDSEFHFKNGNTIVLCGDRNEDTVPNTFTDFILAVCGADTVIDYWDEEDGINLIQRSGDSLFIEDITILPTGQNLDFKPTLWTTDQIYFQGLKVLKKLVVNRQIPKYDKREIQIALKLFESAKGELNDSTMDIAEKLFIATISGSKIARKYFKEFKNKFGELDGAYAEQYEDLTAMIELWDIKK
jgi:hypothetical protein